VFYRRRVKMLNENENPDETVNDGVEQNTENRPHTMSRRSISGLKGAVTKAITQYSVAVTSNEDDEANFVQLEQDILTKLENAVGALELFGQENPMFFEKVMVETMEYEGKVHEDLDRLRHTREKTESSYKGSEADSEEFNRARQTPTPKRKENGLSKIIWENIRISRLESGI